MQEEIIKVIEPEINIDNNVSINSEIKEIDELDHGGSSSTDDDNKLIKTRPRNIFPSYSNDSVSARFRVSRFISFFFIESNII